MKPKKISSKWLPLFEEFVGDLRIQSKDETNPDGGGIPLVMWESQKRFLHEVAEGLDRGVKNFYCLKSRQLGCTTISLAIDLFWVAMHPGLAMAIVSDTESNREKNRAELRQLLSSFPPDYFGDDFYIVKGGDNRTTMRFSNGSRFDFKVAGTKDRGIAWGQGASYAAAHLTELASYGSADALKSFEEALSQKNPNSLYLYESPLALDTPIPTPSGWTTMRDVQSGDMVFDEKGNPVRVVGTSPVFEDRKCYRIDFSNGDHIVADSGHKWRVEEMRWPSNPQWKEKIVTTEELSVQKHIIRIGEPLNMPEADLPIDPYLLGVWLGDGATASVRVTCADADLGEMMALLAGRGCTNGVVTRSKDRAPMFCIHNEIRSFNAADLIGNKHIPAVYLRASESQRRLLLAGMMDTDGSIHKGQYQCNFASTKRELIDGMGELLSSLGIKYVESINSEEGVVRLFPQGHTSVCKKAWRVLFSEFPDRMVFQLSRKRLIHEARKSLVWRKAKCVRIRSITEAPSVPVKCIAVNSPSHLFLAGRTMIPTHNTAAGFNIWYDKWMEGLSDPITKRSFFIGWWAAGNNVIERDDPLFALYGIDKPTREEAEKIAQVKADYDFTIKPEQLAWYRWRESTDSGSDMLLQNQPWTATEAFVVSGQSFFQTRMLAKDIHEIRNNGEMYGWQGYIYEYGNTFFDIQCLWQDESSCSAEDIELRVWEAPVEGGRYVIGCDPAYGRNEHKDGIVVSCWRCYSDKLVQVAEYCTTQVEVRYAAWVLAHLAGSYKDCIVNLELGGGGRIIMNEWDHIRQLIDNQYTLAKTKDPDWENALSQARWFLYSRQDSVNGSAGAYNFEVTNRTKQELMWGLRGAYITRELMVRSVPMLEEMGYVIKDGDLIGAPESRSRKDDRVFAAAFAHRAWVNWRRPEMMSQNLTYQIVTDRETGVASPASEMMNGLINRFWEKVFSEADKTEEHPAWRVDRGLT